MLIEAAQTGRSIIDCVYRILENDLLSRVIELLLRQPTQMRPAPMLAAAEDPPMAQQKRQQLLTLAARSCDAASRARMRSRTASCTVSGTQTDVNSPARNSRASVTASRRLVLTRSPGFFGIKVGATPLQW